MKKLFLLLIVFCTLQSAGQEAEARNNSIAEEEPIPMFGTTLTFLVEKYVQAGGTPPSGAEDFLPPIKNEIEVPLTVIVAARLEPMIPLENTMALIGRSYNIHREGKIAFTLKVIYETNYTGSIENITVIDEKLTKLRIDKSW